MPIYEYQCGGCDHKLEKIQKISDDPLKECPECGTESLRKLVSAAAFRLKGSGWYETDFKKKDNQKNLAKPDEKSATGDDKKESKGNGKGNGSSGKPGADPKPGTVKSESNSTAKSTSPASD